MADSNLPWQGKERQDLGCTIQPRSLFSAKIVYAERGVYALPAPIGESPLGASSYSIGGCDENRPGIQ